jgi:hypothetical protein
MHTINNIREKLLIAIKILKVITRYRDNRTNNMGKHADKPSRKFNAKKHENYWFQDIHIMKYVM